MMGWLLVAGIIVLILIELFGFWGLVVAGFIVLVGIFGFELFSKDRTKGGW